MSGSGRLEVAGLAVGPLTVHELRRRVGLVFQDPDDQLFMPTVAEDVAFGPLNLGLERADVRRRVSEALAAVGWSTRRSGPPTSCRWASAGAWRSRRSSPCAHAAVLDEPSANLDPRARR
jgi:cobalt/nickel transport system ATP-binding protein